MVSVIVKTVNVITAGYVLYIIGGMVYELGRQSALKETTATPQTSFGSIDSNGNPEYVVIDGQVYHRVDSQ